MHRGRCIGLLGGLGVGGAMHYYRTLVQAHEQRGAVPDLVMAHAEVVRVFEYVRADDRDGLAGYLLGFLNRLEAAGAECGVIPAVTPHFCYEELAARTSLPLFNIFDPLRAELVSRSLRRVAVFGSSFVMNSRLYGMVPEAEIVAATAEETAAIDTIYGQLAMQGVGTPEQHRALTEIAQALCRRDGVQAILFAGTDLTSLFHESDTDFPFVDCAALHLRAIVDGVLGPS